MKRIYVTTVALTLFSTHLLAADSPLTVANYGGAWADTLNRICVEPFEESTGIDVRQVATDNSAAQIRAQQMTGNVVWDISPTERSTLPMARDNGWLQPIDWEIVDPENKLPDVARRPYALGAVAYSTAIGYRTDRVPEGETFSGWKDFWDVERFPGPRSLRNTPIENLEFALLADGVATDEVYSVLRTDEGVDRAFAKLDEIKPHITTWWTSSQQPVQYLASGEVFYATAFNGRISQLQEDNVPVKVMWNGASMDISYYSIQKGAPNPEKAMQFMRSCWNDPESLASIARALPYSGFNPDLYDILSAEEARQMPTSEENLAVQFTLDSEFWAENQDELLARWESWQLQ